VPPAPPRSSLSPRLAFRSVAFGLLSSAALLTTVLFLSGVVDVSRHEGLYAVALATGWCFFFYFFPVGAGISFLHCVLWLVWSHP
jgi:hypothetical protein